MKLVQPLVICAVLAAGGYAAWHFTRPTKQDAPPPAPVPVSAAQAKDGSLPIMLPTIGNVRALNTIEIRPQVSGTLVDIAVREGDMVSKNQVLAIIDPRPFKAALDKAQAQLTQDQAQLGNAQADQKRYSALAERDFASRQQLDTQTSTVARLTGVIAADQAAIDEAKINLGFTVLRSPINGRIGLRRVDVGNLVTANSTGPGVFSVVQEQPISVIYTLPEVDLPVVRDAQRKGKLLTLALAPGSGRVLDRGELVTTDNAVNVDSGTIQLRSDFPNPDELLTPGQFVNIKLQVGTATGVMIPHVAVQHGQDGLFVFTVDGNHAIKRAPVQVAFDDGQNAILKNGVPTGTTVVTAGQSRVGDGTKVTFKEDGGGNAKQAAAPNASNTTETQSAER